MIEIQGFIDNRGVLLPETPYADIEGVRLVRIKDGVFYIYQAGDALPQPPPETEQEKAARLKRAAAKAESGQILAVRMQQYLAQVEDFTPEEFSTFATAGLFPLWTVGEDYAQGDRFVHKGVVYETQQPVTAQEHQEPGGEGMLAIYRPISADPDTGDEPDGSLAHPYTFIYGMDVVESFYYSYENALYRAKANMPACVWYPGTPGLWQWELVETGV